jgi:uncharacterized protein YkwD
MSRTFPIALVALAGCAASPAQDPQADEFVTAHNDVRAAALPTPVPPLPALAFDAELKAIAQAWSTRCVFEHSEGDLGENLAFFTGPDSTPADVVDAWASEAAFYQYDTNACEPSEQCGHYTQIVWRETERVGCGVSTCTIPEFDVEGLLWVCNYDPPGNFVGEKPYNL